LDKNTPDGGTADCGKCTAATVRLFSSIAQSLNLETVVRIKYTAATVASLQFAQNELRTTMASNFKTPSSLNPRSADRIKWIAAAKRLLRSRRLYRGPQCLSFQKCISLIFSTADRTKWIATTVGLLQLHICNSLKSFVLFLGLVLRFMMHFLGLSSNR